MKRSTLDQLLLEGHRQIDGIGNKPDEVRVAVALFLRRLRCGALP